MPTELGDPFDITWRGTPPAMLPEDVPVWYSFLQQNPGLFQRLYYNVRIGGVLAPPDLGDEKMRYMYWQNTAKRIDVLGELEKELWLIEVAARPGLRAVGQLQTYLALWWEDPKLNKPIKGVLVCQGIDKDLERSLQFYGMLVRYTT